MTVPHVRDWAEASESFDSLRSLVRSADLSSANEAQTRFDIIDSLIRDVLGWRPGQVTVEEHSKGAQAGFIDYVLKVGDASLVIEAKRIGAAFPTPTAKGRLKLTGSVLGGGEIAAAISQAENYARYKNADAVCVTSGVCWCFFSTRDRDADSYATLLFPFAIHDHPAKLFDVLSEQRVRDGSLETLSNRQTKPEDRLVSVLRDADARIDRNNIADHIVPALNSALYADALLSNPDALKYCFVATEARSKFDALLGMHLADPKPTLVMPARRIKTGQEHGPLDQLVDVDVKDHAPPVTLIIGPVGAGKSMYLKHFENVAGRQLLERRNAHWIYIDFEQMGQAGQPRKFLYGKLLEYLLEDHPGKPTNYGSIVEPAYRDVIAGLARGPLSRVFGDKVEFNRRTTDHIQREFEAVEPYVDRLLRYVATQQLCVVVLDNIDLYEDETLETAVFAEGLALSKRLNAHVIVSVRDRTFVRHRNSAAFDAYELRKLWLDPPPLKTVLSSRLAYSRKVLDGQSARVTLANGMQLLVPNLGVFFEIVQRSVLQGPAGDYIESVADLNIRRGLTLINNFLTSGHIQADRALKSYLEGDATYYFPFHEVFKGTALGQWKHYREARAECLNIFDSRRGVKRIRLLRLALLGHLAARAQRENTVEVPCAECVTLGESLGATSIDVVETLGTLQETGLIRTVSAESVGLTTRVVISRSGGYYLKRLCHTLVYTEQCMHDTAIEDPSVWALLSDLTQQIEAYGSVVERMHLRHRRIAAFLEYLTDLEKSMLGDALGLRHLFLMPGIAQDVMKDADDAVTKADRHYQ